MAPLPVLKTLPFSNIRQDAAKNPVGFVDYSGCDGVAELPRIAVLNRKPAVWDE